MKSWILPFVAVVASLTFLLFMGTFMPVRATPNCRTPEMVRHDVGAAFKNISMMDLSGDELRKFLVGFNAMPPILNITASHVMAITTPTVKDIDIVFFDERGCLNYQTYITKKQFEFIFGSST